MNESFVQSVCIFGSAARRSTDSLSDKDVLIVAGDVALRGELAEAWSRDGWSAAAYSPSQIRGMIRHGSLFIQHLKREGALIIDRSDWLRRQLADAMPKATYTIDALRSIDMIKPIERLCSNRWEVLLAADLAFVFFRNYGIYGLAEEGIYEFDYFKVVDYLAARHKLSVSETDLLLGLRAKKVAYRERVVRNEDDLDIEFLVNICRKVAQMYRVTRIEPASSIRLFPLRYATLRDTEARFVGLFDVGQLDDNRVSKDIASVWNAVTAPRNYSQTIRRIDQDWVTAVETLLARTQRPADASGADVFAV